MTLRAGGFVPGVISAYASSTETRINQGHNGYLVTFPLGVFNTDLFKNQGYYVAGSVYEEWVTTTAPSTTPPSGHTLTQIQYVPLET